MILQCAIKGFGLSFGVFFVVGILYISVLKLKTIIQKDKWSF